MAVKEIPQDDNLRSEPRLPHNEVIYVEILTPGVFDSADLGPTVRPSETIDISANGAQVKTAEPLRIGAILQICVVRESTDARFELAAEVRWQRRLPGSTGYLTGLAFFDADETSIAEWKLVVSSMLSDDDAEHVFC
mgnify:CR=1 FL=1